LSFSVASTCANVACMPVPVAVPVPVCRNVKKSARMLLRISRIILLSVLVTAFAKPPLRIASAVVSLRYFLMPSVLTGVLSTL